MSVHLGEARDEKSIGAVNHQGLLRHGHLVDVADRADNAVADNNRLLGDYPLVGHRNYVDVNECGDVGGRHAGRD